jgi:ribonuclease HII
VAAFQGELFGGPPLDAPIGAVDRWCAAHAELPVVGIDEAGRGPLAGFVVAAAVVLPIEWATSAEFAGLNDSKKLTEACRTRLFAALLAARPPIGIGRASPSEIDTHNILGATRLAMRRALDQCERRLGRPAGLVLVDGNLPLPGLNSPQHALVGGDGRAWCIAAASVIAKVVRDRQMVAADLRYPGYAFARHKGYGTRAHLQALSRLGPSPIHRASFHPKALQPGGELNP